MSLEYTIGYTAENSYEDWVDEAFWQFTVIPEHNATQDYIEYEFENSHGAPIERSVNGYGFETIRIHFKERFRHIGFQASFKLVKKKVNPFEFDLPLDPSGDYHRLGDLSFQVKHASWLKATRLTTLGAENSDIFLFDRNKSVFENLVDLNHWTFIKIYYKTGVTDVDTPLHDIIENRHGVCQDFVHLFCALARANGVPARYVSGYLHQGQHFFGDMQMHAWAEAYVPEVGWKGFDPTNDMLANEHHIKVAHGKDYKDCAPLKGVVFTTGKNTTSYSVNVQAEQQQQ